MPQPILAYVTTIAITQFNNLRGQNAFMTKQGWTLHGVAAPDPVLQRLADRDHVITHAVPMTRQMSPLADLLALWRMFVTLRRIRPQVLHLSTPKGALLGAIAGWLCRIPVRIFYLRGLPSSGRDGLGGTILRVCEWLTARLCHQHICVSPSLLEYARNRGVLRQDQGIVIGKGMSNGVDLRALEEGCAGEAPEALRAFCVPHSLIIGFCGRLVRDKGIEELAFAWRNLREEFPDARLLICGSHEPEDPVAPEVVRQLSQDPRVHITGWIDKNKLGHYYRAMHLFAFPSYREGFPNGPMEAAAYGLPVIVSDAVGCIDAVEPEVTGLVAKERDATTLEQTLRRYLQDDDLRLRHGQAGRERVGRDFAPEAIWAGLDAEYKRLLQESGWKSER